MKWFGTCAVILMASAFARADGGTMVGQIEREGLRISVFAAPAPLRAGVLDVTFLVQDLASNLPVRDAGITVSVQKLSPPSPSPVSLPSWCSTIPVGTRVPATSGHATNKLLMGAYLPLTEPGRWELRIDVRHEGRVFSDAIPLDVLPPLAPLSEWWPFIALVPFGIFLFVWRERLLHR
jgi:hypothetical protein